MKYIFSICSVILFISCLPESEKKADKPLSFEKAEKAARIMKIILLMNQTQLQSLRKPRQIL